LIIVRSIQISINKYSFSRDYGENVVALFIDNNASIYSKYNQD